MSSRRSDSAAVHIPAIGDLVIGGSCSSKHLRTVELLVTCDFGDVNIREWINVQPMIKPKIYPNAVLFGEAVIIIDWNWDSEILSLTNGQLGQWTEIFIPNKPMGYEPWSMCALNDQILIASEL